MFIAKITKPFSQMTQDERLVFVESLHQKREAVKQQSVAYRRRNTKKEKTLSIQFASPELAAIFQTLPKECQDLIKKGK